jgi:hypothetical protein
VDDGFSIWPAANFTIPHGIWFFGSLAFQWLAARGYRGCNVSQQFVIAQETASDFDRAVSKGRWRQFISRLTRRSDELLSYGDVRKQHSIKGQHDLGVRIVPIDRIVGSMGRCRDFDRAFYPRQTASNSRWMGIARASYRNVALPLVELYKVGDSYFVQDGHHRISVARARGQDFIDAHVIEVEVQ